jgi:uncharacterized membrane protein YjjB (DUF3815 family)
VAFAAQSFGYHVGGAALGSFLAAVAASLGSSLVEGLRPDLPRLVVFLPALWLLVPGSLGLLSATALIVNPGGGGANAVGVASVVCAIAVGLMIGAAVARSVRGALRRLRGSRPLRTRRRPGQNLAR